MAALSASEVVIIKSMVRQAMASTNYDYKRSLSVMNGDQSEGAFRRSLAAINKRYDAIMRKLDIILKEAK